MYLDDNGNNHIDSNEMDRISVVLMGVLYPSNIGVTVWKSIQRDSSGTRRRRTRAISDRVEEETLYKNKEGYCDPTAGKAIQDASRIPHHVKEAHKALKDIASLLGFEILVLRDRKTGRVYRWKQ